jgi:hypothetical protein
MDGVKFRHSESLADRGSVFVASIAYPVKSARDAERAIRSMSAHAAHVGADHHMSAYRLLQFNPVCTASKRKLGGGGESLNPPKQPKRAKSSAALASAASSFAAAFAPAASSSVKRKRAVIKASDDDGEANGGKRILTALNKVTPPPPHTHTIPIPPSQPP